MRKLSLVAFALTLVACDRSRPELEKTLVQVKQISAEKDSLLKDVMATTQFIADVNGELAKVRQRNVGKPTKSQPGETESNLTPTQARAQLLSKVKEATTRLNDAESRLNVSRKRVAELSAQSAETAKQIAGFDSTISSFKSIIDSQKAEITSLTAQIVALTDENTKLKAANVQLASEKKNVIDERDHLTMERNMVYYIVGTKAELLQKHIIEQTGGTLGLGKVQVPMRALNPSDFMAIDKTKTAEIALPKAGKPYKILSRQDVGALEIMPDKNGRLTGAVKIKNADQFWAASKYLIVIEQ